MKIFARLVKVDEAQRKVYGRAVQEVVDRSGEIFDYAKSKPHFESWSSDIAKNTDGKSLGNVRAMHGKIAAGKLTDIEFNDAEKAIDVCAEVVDDNEWKKCTSGVYTGFSIGGKYGDKWDDETNKAVKRYEAIPSEISLVDLPCVPTANFTMVKADGMTEEREFAQPDPEKLAVDELAKILDEGKVKPSELVKFVAEQEKIQAEAQKAAKLDAFKTAVANPLITNGEVEALAKDWLTTEQMDAIQGDAIAKSFGFLLELRKIAGVEVVEVTTTEETAEPETTTVDKSVSAAVADFSKEPMAKGLMTLGRMADACSMLWSLHEDATYEAESEGDGSAVPDRLQQLCIEAGEILCEMAEEETQEMANKADSIESLKKLFKAKSMNKEYQQRTHDRVIKMGAKCAKMDKTESLNAESLCKAIGVEVENLEAFTKLFALTKAKADKWDALPAAPKGVLRSFEKGQDSLPATEQELSAGDEKLLRAVESGDPLALMKVVHRIGGTVQTVK